MQRPSAAFCEAAHPVAQVVFSSDNAFILIWEDSPLITSLMECWTAEIQGVMLNSYCNKTNIHQPWKVLGMFYKTMVRMWKVKGPIQCYVAILFVCFLCFYAWLGVFVLSSMEKQITNMIYLLEIEIKLIKQLEIFA